MRAANASLWVHRQGLPVDLSLSIKPSVDLLKKGSSPKPAREDSNLRPAD